MQLSFVWVWRCCYSKTPELKSGLVWPVTVHVLLTFPSVPKYCGVAIIGSISSQYLVLSCVTGDRLGKCELIYVRFIVLPALCISVGTYIIPSTLCIYSDYCLTLVCFDRAITIVSFPRGFVRRIADTNQLTSYTQIAHRSCYSGSR